MPNVGHSVDMSMKVEQLHSRQSAIAWITVYRTCLQRDTSCSGCLEVSRHFLKRGERTDPGAANRTRSRTQIARTLTRMAFAERTLTALVQWCVTVRVKSIERCGGCSARSPGEHHLDHPTSCQQQGGRRRCHCTYRRSQGNRFDF